MGIRSYISINFQERRRIWTHRKKMKKIILFLFISILTISFLQSCSKKLATSNIKKISNFSYDTTVFDYVFIEAIEQKLMGNAGEALKYLEHCIQINPRSDASFYQMAQITLMREDIKNGKRFALKAASINDKNIWYLVTLANIYYKEKNLDSTIFYYNKALTYYPQKDDIRLTLGNIYSENKQYEKAKEIYEYFEKKFGLNESTTLALIKNFIAAGNYKEAEEKILLLLKQSPDEVLYNGLLAEIYRSEGQKEKATEVYKKLLKNEPGDPQTQLSVSDFLMTEKDYDELLDVFNTVILNEKISREDKIKLCIKIMEDPELISKKGNELEVSFMVLEAAYTSDDVIPLLLAELYQKQSRIVEAILRLEELIKANPDNYYPWERLLLIYSDIKDYDNLFIKGKECATKFNRSFLAKVLYANAAIEKKEYTISQEELRKAKILAGDQKDLQVQVLTMEADVYYRLKEYKKAFEIFEEALKLNPENLMVINNYAYYLAEQDQELKEAEKMAKKVIETEKGNTTYLDTYAWVLFKRGKLKEAEKIMEKIVNSGNKDDAEWYEHYAYIMKALRNCLKAKEYWKRAMDLDGNKSDLINEINNCKSSR
jgi:tetratricopeptide (TPR) repeat protein